MDFYFLVPIAMFASITYAIKAIVDARVRRRMVESNGSEDLVRAMLQADEQNRRLGALKWGIVLTAVGAAFMIQHFTGLDESDPATYGLLFVATGLGLLGYHVVASRRQ